MPNFRRRGFTLVELLVTMTLGVLLLGAVMSVVLVLAQTAVKNERMERLASQARRAQEIITKELNNAVNNYNENTLLINRPVYEISDGESPPSYKKITYRTSIGPPGQLIADVPVTSTSVTFFAPGNLRPEVGDYFILDKPNLGRGILITAVSDSRAENTDGSVTVTLDQTLAHGTAVGFDPLLLNAPHDGRVGIQRKRSFEVVTTEPNKSASLRWFTNANAESYLILADTVSASDTFIFRQIPDDSADLKPATETATSWYLVLKDTKSIFGLSGSDTFYSTSSVGGSGVGASSSLIMSKAGNGMSLSSPTQGGNLPPTTSVSTTSVSTTSTSTTATTSTTSLSTSTSTASTTSKTTTTSTKNTSTSTKNTSTATTSTKNTSTKATTVATTSKNTTSATTSNSTSSATTSKSTTTTIPFDG